MPALSEWVRYSVPDDFWPIAIILICLSVAGLCFGFYYFIRMRLLENIPTSKIRSAAQGYLELIGKGQLLEGPEIVSPLTRKTCTWYSYTVQERRRSGRKNQWVTIERATSDGLFLLVDDTGKCVIDPDGATVVPTVTNTWYGASARPTPGAPRKGSLFSGSYRYTEKRMHPGDDLYAIGFYQTVGGAGLAVDVSAEVTALLKEWKTDSNQMLSRYDKNKDGRIDMQEWELVRKAALDVVMKRHHELKTIPPVNLLGQTRDVRRPFILSATSQDILIKRFRYYAGGLIALFFICGVIVTWMLNLRFSGG